MPEKCIAVLGTLDTKGPEYEYLLARLRALGLKPVMLDMSCREATAWPADCSCYDVAAAAGHVFSILAPLNKTEAGKVMVQGAITILRQLDASTGWQRSVQPSSRLAEASRSCTLNWKR